MNIIKRQYKEFELLEVEKIGGYRVVGSNITMTVETEGDAKYKFSTSKLLTYKTKLDDEDLINDRIHEYYIIATIKNTNGQLKQISGRDIPLSIKNKNIKTVKSEKTLRVGANEVKLETEELNNKFKGWYWDSDGGDKVRQFNPGVPPDLIDMTNAQYTKRYIATEVKESGSRI